MLVQFAHRHQPFEIIDGQLVVMLVSSFRAMLGDVADRYRAPAVTSNQAGFLKSLKQQAGESYDPSINKAEASEEIGRLKGSSITSDSGSREDAATDKQKGFINVLQVRP